jgi:hypothetical protein
MYSHSRIEAPNPFTLSSKNVAIRKAKATKINVRNVPDTERAVYRKYSGGASICFRKKVYGIHIPSRKLTDREIEVPRYFDRYIFFLLTGWDNKSSIKFRESYKKIVPSMRLIRGITRITSWRRVDTTFTGALAK